MMHRLWSAGLGLGVTLAAALPVSAEPPGIYYSWAELDTTVAQCLRRAQQVMEDQSLTLVGRNDTSVAAGTSDLTAVFVCLEQPAATTVMVIVASTNDDVAAATRNALVEAF